MSEQDLPYEVLCDESDREKWLDLRRTGIGGSDAPAILGQTSWGSATSVQASKWGFDEPQEEREELRWGHLLEAPMLERLTEETKKRFTPFGMLLRSKEYPWAICTPDGRTFNEDPESWAQCKSTILREEWEDGLPDRVWTQVQHEMLVTGADHEYVAALLFPRTFVWTLVKRDEEYLNSTHIPAMAHFWELTQGHEAVEVDGSEATRQALGRMHPLDNGESIRLDDTYFELGRDLAGMKADQKALELETKGLENRLRAAIGDATFGTLPDGSGWSFKTQTRKAHEVKESTFRVLRRTKGK